jgi:acyl-CoA synthetase (AMP-forming)/AMP-acid ligase II/NAD(P)-dependent dehydrogenase (short-subunit alcohol dehydrogenase family)
LPVHGRNQTDPAQGIGAKMRGGAVEMERRLLALESVYECKSIPRGVAVGRNEGPGAERIVIYAVPAASVRPERIAEWVASLRKQLVDGAGENAGFDLVAVSRLPLNEAGQVDEAALCRFPVLDEELAGAWEERLKGLTGVRDALVLVQPEQAPLPPIHYSKLFSEPVVDAAGAEGITPPAEPQTPVSLLGAPERRLAISHGKELRGAEQLPHLLGEMLLRAARENPDHGVRFIRAGDSERFLSYPELLLAADRLLGGLRRAGLRPGDKVFFQLPDNQAILTAFWACVLGGFVPVPAALAPSYEGTNSAAGKLCNAMRMLDGPLVLTSREFAPHIVAVCRSQDMPKVQVESVEDLSAEAVGDWHAGDPNDLALMMLTSGSTGVPKGVQLSHRNLIRRSAGSVELNRLSNEEVTLNWMPLDHVAGIVYFHLRDVFTGCQQIHAATDLVLQDPLIWPDWINRHRVTITFAPNFAFGLVNDRAEQLAARARSTGGTWDLSCLRYLLNGAEAIVTRTARRFLQLFIPYGLSPTAMSPVWGMSETSSGTTYSDTFRLESSHDEQAFVEVGRPIPGFSVRIVDENDQPILERAVGRLQVKGDTVTAGYYNQPDLNAESFTGDGWFKTGDLGYLNNGRLTITGREKDVIVINSVNYHCHEIEGAVEEIQGIEKTYTAACAVRDANANTDRLAVFFHPAAGPLGVSLELIQMIRRTVRERLGVSPDYLLPVEREAIPKTSIGKIQRTQLAKRFDRGDFADVVRRVEVLIGGAQTLPDWFFRPVWRRAELSRRGEIGRVLVFADSLGMGEHLRQKVHAAEQECVLVLSGREFVEEGERLTIDPGNGEHYRRAVESLARRGFALQSIVHLWTYGQEASHPRCPQELERAQEMGVLSVLRLAQALTGAPAGPNGCASSHRALQLLVVSSDLQQVEDGGCPDVRRAPPAFQNAPLLGLLKSIPQEYPGFSCRHLDLQPATHAENAELILRELSGLSQDAEVAYRGGQRWVRRLRRAELPAQSPRPLPLEKGGLYLLSGGLGGIGLEVAQYLLRHFQACLLLVGRTTLGDRDTAAVQRLDTLRSLERLAEATGGRVSYAALDAGNGDALRGAAQRAEERWGRELKGIFHLAGVYHELPVSEETATGFAEVLHSKLNGTWALHQLLDSRPGSLFVSFSSVNGYFGGYGVSAYAAANAFLESFSEYQREFTGVNAYCISWSLWDDVGMSRGLVAKNMARGRGFCAISPRQGLASLVALLQRPASNTLVGLDGSNSHVRRIAEGLPLPAQVLIALVAGEPGATEVLASRAGAEMGIQDRYGIPVLCQVKPAPQAAIDAAGRIDGDKARCVFHGGGEAASEPVGAEGELEKTIASVWREVLNLERLSVTDNFFDIGGTSVLAALVYRRIHDIVGDGLAMTDLFRFPTVRSLCRHLEGGEDHSRGRLKADGDRGKNSREQMLRRRRA